MKNKSAIMATCVALALVLALAGGAWAAAAGTSQASITLLNSDMVLGHANDTDWTLAKDTALPDISNIGTATWEVTATKGATTHNILSVNGYMEVKNTGGAPATIGNIVVNLQKQVTVKGKTTWISAAANMADATSGIGAPSANIAAAGSQEATGPNYVVSSVKGTFIKTPGSGTIEFTNANNDTIWAIIPQQSIAVGQSVKLFFTATFDNTVLNIPVGAQVRAEVIVTFGNSGARGGSGASSSNIDINGNCVIDPDEANVRSVPTRITRTVPPLQTCNASVNLSDPRDKVVTTGTVTLVDSPGFDNGGIGGGVAITDTTTSPYAVTAPVDGGPEGGTITNTAYLDGQDYVVSLILGYTTNSEGTIVPITHDFTCFYGIHLHKPSTVNVAAPPPAPPHAKEFSQGDFCTFNQGGWQQRGEGGNQGTLYTYFGNVYSSGSVEVGIPGTGGFSMIFKSHDVQEKVQGKMVTVTEPAPYSINLYLTAQGTAAALTEDMENPTTTSSGSLGGETLALKLNVDFSGKVPEMPAGFGNLIYYNTPKNGVDSLDGKTVSEILAVANTALGGGALPDGYSYEDLAGLVQKLNGSFENGNVTRNPGSYLHKP